MRYESIRTPKFTLCFPALFTPRAAQAGQEPKFSCVAVFPKGTDISPLVAIAKKVAQDAYPKGVPAKFDYPFRDGNRDADPTWGDIYKDAIFVRFSTKIKPAVCDASRTLINDPDKVYGGQVAIAAVHAYAYDVSGNRGVAFGLDAVQIVADGERLGRTPEKTIQIFDQLEEPAADADANDPFKGLGL